MGWVRTTLLEMAILVQRNSRKAEEGKTPYILHWCEGSGSESDFFSPSGLVLQGQNLSQTRINQGEGSLWVCWGKGRLSCICIPGWRLTCLFTSSVWRCLWSLVLSAQTSAPFSAALAFGELVGCFFTITERCLWSLTLSGFMMLSNSISCYTVLSIILGNSISLTFQCLSQFLSFFFPDWDTKKSASISSLSPMISSVYRLTVWFFFSWQSLFLWSFSPVLLRMWVPLCRLFCGISHLSFISLFNHSPSCRGSYWIGSWHHICTPSAD